MKKTINHSLLTIHRKSKGVTLIELLIYMALVSIFIITLTDIFSSTLAVRTESEATSAVDEDGRFILSRLDYDIARAGSINIPPQIGQTRSNLRMDISGITYEYSENGGNLQLSNDQGTNNINSSETTVSSLSFQRIANSSIPGTRDTVKIQFTLTSKTQRPQGPESKTFNTTVGLR